MRIYVAGKISGLDRKSLLEKFEAARKELAAQGHSVFVPTVLPEYDDVAHEDYMHICYAMIDICDAVYMLADWRYSTGACMEYDYAMRRDKKILFEEESVLPDKRQQKQEENMIISLGRSIENMIQSLKKVVDVCEKCRYHDKGLAYCIHCIFSDGVCCQWKQAVVEE